MDCIKENHYYKSEEWLTVDSAKWYLDASFSLTFSFINEQYTIYNTDTLSIKLPKTGEPINMNDIHHSVFHQADSTVAHHKVTANYKTRHILGDSYQPTSINE